MNEQHTRRRLYRDVENGKLGGVCAGLANYFGLEIWLVRILVLAAFFMGFGFIVPIYFAAWLILDPMPAQQVDDEQEPIRVKTRSWRAGSRPAEALDVVERRFAELEKRLQQMERFVTSEKFRLHRAFKDLGRRNYR